MLASPAPLPTLNMVLVVELPRFSDSPTPEQLLSELDNAAVSALLDQCATRQGGRVSADRLDLSVLSLQADERDIDVRLQAFFVEVVGGCNCHDDPFESQGYCILALHVGRHDGRGRVTVAPD